MFSGGDSSGDGINTINRFGNFQLASANGQIDWASLAQQWIQMKDNKSEDIGGPSIPSAPPPPNISGNYPQSVVAKTAKSTYEEKGEADMDMDDDEDHVEQKFGKTTDISRTIASTVSQQIVEPPIALQSQWFIQQALTQATTVPVVEIEAVNSQQQSAAGQWNVWPPRVNVPPPVLHGSAANPTAHIPQLMKMNVPNPNAVKPPSPQEEVAVCATMDAGKRKILPAWIREGLEKMEREKQKQLDREQHHYSNHSNDSEKGHFSNELTVTNNKTVLLESDNSGNEEAENDDENNIDGKVVPMSSIKPQSDNDDSDVDAERNIGKSYELKLADLMIVVRRTLTELLLEVTNEEISNIAYEAIKSRKSKASSAQVIRKSALTSIAGKLGLAAYDDSSNGETSASENEPNDNENDEDSDEEIKANIRIKRRTFAKISDEIEERIAASASREEQKLKFYLQAEQQQQEEESKTKQRRDYERHHNKEHHPEYVDINRHATTSANSAASGKNYDKEFGETTESKLQYSNGKRQKDRSAQRKERTTRFSDNKDSKHGSLSNAATYITQMQPIVKNVHAAISVNPTTGLIPVATSSIAEGSSMYTLPKSYGGGTTSINNILNAAEAALEKVTKSKSSSTSERHRHRHRHSRHSSDDDDDSSDSDTSSSDSSRNSKYSRASSSKRRHRERSSRSSRYRKHSHRRRTRSKTRSHSRSRSRSSYSSKKRSRH